MLTKSFIITLINNYDATIASRNVVNSIKETKSELDPIVFPATTPDTVDEGLKILDMENVQYTYPIKPEQDGLDLKSGLYLQHYPTANIKNRIACMVSHMRLWKECIDRDEPIVILEHDALFTRQFKISDLTNDFKGGIVGLNDPRGATRKSGEFHSKVSSKMGLQSVPDLGDNYPQGLAGNSAYLITPHASKILMRKVKEIGMWPNDAIMNRQFFPWMQVVYPYYTTIQKGLKSTTTK